jgi:hypothetical protein
MPNDDPFAIPPSNDARYWKLVELPKSHLLPVTPSLTSFALNPETAPDTHTFGSFVVYALGRCCALSEAEENVISNNANGILLIILLQVVAIRARRRVS